MKSFIPFFGASAVILGALGAHALQDVLSPEEMASFKTAVLYQLVHSVALLAVANDENRKSTMRLWMLGILFFSFSIYLLVFDRLLGINLRILGPLTPIGGVLFVAGWLSLWWPKKA
jgi:uncharacterized membrane protein YgdD (TMEM256/DUF423 family)